MNVLVIGATGLVGNHVLRAAAKAGWNVQGTSRQPNLPGLLSLAGGDDSTFARYLDASRPDVVVDAAGFTWVDGCEQDPARAWYENVQIPRRQVERCRASGIRYVYYSTSYVFDGIKGPYGEQDTPHPVNVYGRCKLRAEQELSDLHPGGVLIPRLIWVYGSEGRKKNFSYQLLRAMRAGEPIQVPLDQLGNATWAGDIATETLRLLREKVSGVRHLASDNLPADRVGWAQAMVAAFIAAGETVRNGFQICPVPSANLRQPALRPLDARLCSQQASSPYLNATALTSIVAELLNPKDEPVMV